ncbi:Serine/threonine-protein kinase sepA [Heracleum sosnowskyi]|uniref:Serine/threonine-protein kinase sepA n=1 Tax=Heracleum sosnowskyi TaxID=360622 RepID=A0AAD8N4G1_9APIA|nr:Serine/threonine-protein kinase sepA [Heracleum sosnowskyi]
MCIAIYDLCSFVRLKVDYCVWRGVTCDNVTFNVVALNLSSLNLDGEISTSIGDLKGLLSIDLKGNLLSGQIPDEIGDCVGLKSFKSVSSLSPDEPEDVIVSAFQKLTAFFHQRPEQKFVFITQHGLLPLVELLEVPKNRVTCSVLQLSNQIIRDNTEFQENACLVGLIPSIMSFAVPDRPREIRMEAAYFLQQLCHSRYAILCY